MINSDLHNRTSIQINIFVLNFKFWQSDTQHLCQIIHECWRPSAHLCQKFHYQLWREDGLVFRYTKGRQQEFGMWKLRWEERLIYRTPDRWSWREEIESRFLVGFVIFGEPIFSKNSYFENDSNSPLKMNEFQRNSEKICNYKINFSYYC